jgi:hypothetical protein
VITKSTGEGSGEDQPALQKLILSESGALWRLPGAGWRETIDPLPQGLLSGAFNPRHRGHDGLRVAAEAWIGGPVYFEMPLANADKPALGIDEAAARCGQFQDQSLLVTRAATFVEKARILPGMTFVVGADTAVRVVAPRFYGPEDDPVRAEAAMLDCLDELRQLGCRFLVAARCLDGCMLRLADASVPRQFQDLFTELPENLFRLDVSSSEMRSGGDHS